MFKKFLDLLKKNVPNEDPFDTVVNKIHDVISITTEKISVEEERKNQIITNIKSYTEGIQSLEKEIFLLSSKEESQRIQTLTSKIDLQKKYKLKYIQLLQKQEKAIVSLEQRLESLKFKLHDLKQQKSLFTASEDQHKRQEEIDSYLSEHFIYEELENLSQESEIREIHLNLKENLFDSQLEDLAEETVNQSTTITSVEDLSKYEDFFNTSQKTNRDENPKKEDPEDPESLFNSYFS